MFVEKLSDDAYLEFLGKYGHDEWLCNVYVNELEKIEENLEEYGWALAGYITVSGDIPEIRDGIILIYDHTIDSYLVPYWKSTVYTNRVEYVYGFGNNWKPVILKINDAQENDLDSIIVKFVPNLYSGKPQLYIVSE